MKTSSKKQLRRKLLCALVAGALAAPFAAQTAYALPIEGANAAANKTEADISITGTTMDIAGKTEHNILKWEDFSIEQNEKVRFDGGSQTRDYLNLVTGEGASNIYGTIEGGRNVYLVNPHGILFAKGSEVNTGALYLSAANVDAVASAVGTSWGGNSPLSATAQMGDVLNLGTVKTSKLYIEGKNVTVLNTDAVTDTNGTPLTGSAVTIRSEKAPHIGYDVGNKITKNIKVGSTPTPYQVSDYASTAADHHKASAKSRGWFVQRLNGAPHADYDYMRVHDVYELQHIEANLRGRYMLAGDINAGETSGWNHIGYHDPEGFMPIGGNGSSGPQFKGRFDGVGHRIEHLHINRRDADEDSYIGLFGNVNGARVENLSIVDGYVTGKDHVGGIAGAAERTLIRNVSFSGVVSGLSHFGGIVGTAKYSTICNAYNAGKVKAGTYVGGIVGAGERVTLQNVWNAGEIIGGGDGRDAFIGGIAGAMKNSTVQNALHTGTVARGDQPSQDEAQTVGGIVGQADGGTVSHAVWKAGSVTQGCSPTFIAHAVGEVQNNTAVEDDAERSEADMKKAATYTDWKDENGNALVATEGGKGTPWRIYEGKTMPLLTALMKGTKRLEKTYDGKTFGDGDAHIISDTPLEKNAGTYDARGIYSDAFGYDLIGSTYRIAPRVLTMSGVASQTKTYDGTTAADAAQFHATLNNIVAGEESLVTATATGAAYNSKDVRAANKVIYTLALSGAGAANYVLDKTTLTGTGTISPKQLNLALTGGARFDKTYDGTANVTQTLTKDGNYTLTNFVNGEGEGITITGAGTYTDKNAGTGKAVTFGGLTLTGAGAGNYSLSTTTLTTTGDIAKRALTLEGTAGTQFTKTYDGNATVTQSLARGTNYRLAGVVEGEGTNIVALNESAAQGTYATANAQAAGMRQNVTFTNLALTGSGAGNYTLAASKTFENAGRITPKELNLALASGARFDKTYDGNANVAQTLAKGTNYSLTGFVTGEGTDIELSAVTGKYADKNAARDKAVTFGGLTLTGTGAGNYVLNKTALTGTGTISQRALTLGAVAAQSKTYDGTTAADTSKFHAALNNAVAGDSVTATATGAAYNDKNVAAAATIDYTGVALAGADAGNYTLAAIAAQGAGSITHRTLTLTAAPQSIVQGEPLPSFTGRADGFADGEDERVFGTDGITFGTTLTNTDTPGSYGVTGRIGSTSDGVLGNYRIGQAAGNANAFTIHAAALPGGLLASLVQDAAPRFDLGFGQEVYVFGLPCPVPTATLGIYRFAAARDISIEGVRLD